MLEAATGDTPSADKSIDMKGGVSAEEADAAADDAAGSVGVGASEPLILFLKSEMMSARMECGVDEEIVGEDVMAEAFADAARGAASTVVAESSI